VGIKNAWLHTFFSTAFLSALATTVLIIYVMPVPVSDAIQGAYLVAIAMTGIVLGIGATIFKEITEGLGCLLGGFCLSMWLLTLTPGSLLPEPAPKVILISVMSVASFCLYFSHYTRDYALIILISFGGATVSVLGIDCFSRAGLKEFWVYVWDLNEDLFPLGTVTYPVTKGIRVETAAIIIICLAGIVSQLKLWRVIQEKRAKKAAEKAEDERNLQVEEEAVGRQVEAANSRERQAWERTYGDGEDDRNQEEHMAVGSGDSGVGDMESEKRMRHVSGMSTMRHSQDGVIIEMAEMATPPEVPPKSPPPAGLMTVEENKEGMVTVRVAKDDYPQAPASPSIRDPEERAWIMGADGDVRSATRQSLRPQSSISRAMTTSPTPDVVPLPFQVAEEDATERGTIGDRSSLAGTFADDEDGRGSRRNSMARRLSQGSMNLLRSLSQRSKGRELARERGHESSEDLVIPRGVSRTSRRDDDNQSLAVTVDNESLHGSLDDGERTPRDTRAKSIELKLGDNLNVKDRPISAAETVATDILNMESGLQSPTKGTGSEVGARSDATADTPKAAKSTVSMNSRRSLTRDSLPQGLSRTALKYRTNEWVKHASVADAPAPEPIQIAHYPIEEEEPGPAKGESPAPVIVEELQQTAETGVPAPAPSRSATAMSNYDRSMSRSDSRLSVAGRLATNVSPDQGRGSPNATSPVGQVHQVSGRRSTSGMHNVQPIYEEDGDLSHYPSPEEGNSGPSSKAPSPQPQDFRSPPPGVVSYNSPQTLIGQRELFLRNKSQGNISNGVDYSLPTNPTPSDAGSVYNYYPDYGYQPPSPGDDIPLSQRKAIMRQSSLLASSSSLPRSSSALALPTQTPDNLPFDSHQPARKSNLPTPAARQAQLASFRQSVQAELRAGTPVVPSGNGRETPFMHFSNSTTNLLPGQIGPGVSGLGMTRESEVQRSIDHQRAALLREKEAEAQAREMERWEKERNDKAFEQRMRSGPALLEAHREAMRRMQEGAK